MREIDARQIQISIEIGTDTVVVVDDHLKSIGCRKRQQKL